MLKRDIVLFFVIVILGIFFNSCTEVNNGPSSCQHNLVWEEIYAPTCTVEGREKYWCNICGITEIILDINALWHDEKGSEATCTTDKVCARLNCDYIIETMLWHITPDGIEPTCTDDGNTGTGICLREDCSDTVTVEVIQKLGHDTTGAAATCTTAKICARLECEHIITAVLGHDTTGAAATCTTAKTCARLECDHIIVAVLGHDATGEAANCTTAKTCARQECDHIINNATGHNFNQWQIINSTFEYIEETRICLNNSLHIETHTIEANLAQKLQWLQTNAVSDQVYNIIIKSSENINNINLSFSNRNNIIIHITSYGDEKQITLSTTGSMFTISSGVTLILNDGITLKGRNGNDYALITINKGGELVMNNGSRLIDNNSSYGSYAVSMGGGVNVKGTFTMNGGEITNNSACAGGGVFIEGGNFIMNEGRIFSNQAQGNATYSGRSSGLGGGVYIYNNGNFEMKGGVISGNRTSSGNGNMLASGGGVYINGGTFQKTGGGIIYGNNAVNSTDRNSAGGGNTRGHAVYWDTSSNNTVTRYRDTTLNINDNISTNISINWGQ